MTWFADPETEDARVLWPMLCPSRANNVPEFDLIVFGKVPSVRADIIWLGANAVDYFIFVRGPTKDSATSATEGLLLTTMAALDLHYIEHVYYERDFCWKAACLPNGSGAGWYEE